MAKGIQALLPGKTYTPAKINQRTRQKVLSPGYNCWKKAKAVRGEFLIDCDAYYSALYEALIQAGKSIYIAGWDINSQTRLVLPENKIEDWPTELASLLNKLISRRKDLHVYILTWDYASFYMIEREWFSSLKFSWEGNKRLKFYLDDQHPIGASQHQKVVVIDDMIAFCGGLDLTSYRWDTRAHDPENKDRVDLRKKRYTPFHDVQIGVTGPAASAIGDIFRQRWERARRETLNPPGITGYNKKIRLFHEFSNIDFAVSRTFPPYRDCTGTREIERLYLDMIRSAKKFLYFENQYFTSGILMKALAESLSSPIGPEVIIVLPLKTEGWLEDNFMGIKQAAALKKLYDSDKFSRLGVYYPYIPGLREGEYLKVHSKLLIVDDKMLTIGSANLTNRSMSFDSECNLAMEKANSYQGRMIRHFHSELLSEHLGESKREVERYLKSGGSIKSFIGKYTRQKKRHLATLLRQKEDFTMPGELIEFGDLEKPILIDEFFDKYLTVDIKIKRRKLYRKIGVILAVAAALALVVWGIKKIPFQELFRQENIEIYISAIQESRFGLLGSILVFAFLTTIFVPLNLIILATATVLNAFPAFICVVAGASVSASLNYLAGLIFGKKIISRISKQRFSRIKEKISNKGIATLFVIRMIPVAPFSLVNIVCGAVRYPFSKYLIATILGEIPGTSYLIIFQKSLLSLIFKPSLLNLSILILSVVLLIIVIHIVKKRFSV